MVGERKAKRKAARLEKKQRKRAHANRIQRQNLKQQSSKRPRDGGLPKRSQQKQRSAKKRKRPGPKAGAGRGLLPQERKQTPFEELLAEQNLLKSREGGGDRFATAEDAEIEYLEKKLGLGKERKKENVEKSWGQFEKDLAKDGFSKGMAGFLRELESKGGAEEALSDTDSFGLDGAESDQDDAEEEFSEISSERDRPEPEDAIYIPKKDIYGKAATAPSLQQSEAAKAESLRIKRRLKGLINRLAESNISPICTDILGVYKVESRRDVTESVCEVIFGVLESSKTVLKEFAKVFAALVAALGVHLGQETAALFLERTVQRIEEVHGGDERKATNLAVFLAYLFLFEVTSSTLLYGLLEQLAASFADDDIHIISVVTDYAGSKLRSDDPVKLKGLIEKLQDSKSKSKSAYVDFLLQKIYDLKNNKLEGAGIIESIQRLRKWLQRLKIDSESVHSPLEISYEDFKCAGTLGRWWVVGGVWRGQQKKIQDYKSSERASGTSKANPVNQVLLDASPSLLQKAKSQRMNTELRRSLFCVIMASSDYVEAFQRLVALNLKDIQNREIVHVLMKCCGSSRRYNPYFAHLSQRLCEHDHKFKFTFQLAFWDAFKQLEEFKPQRILNLAELLAHLVSSFALSLSVLKVVEFSQLDNGGVCFFNALFHRILLRGGRSKNASRSVLKVFLRLGKSSDFLATSSGIELFFHHHLYTATSNDEEDAALLKKRCKAVKELFDVIATSQNDAGDSDSSGAEEQ